MSNWACWFLSLIFSFGIYVWLIMPNHHSPPNLTLTLFMVMFIMGLHSRIEISLHSTCKLKLLVEVWFIPPPPQTAWYSKYCVCPFIQASPVCKFVVMYRNSGTIGQQHVEHTCKALSSKSHGHTSVIKVTFESNCHSQWRVFILSMIHYGKIRYHEKELAQS